MHSRRERIWKIYECPYLSTKVVKSPARVTHKYQGLLPLSREVAVCRNTTGCTENLTPLYLCTESHIPEDIEFRIKCRKIRVNA